MYPACILHVSCMYFDVSRSDTSRYIEIQQDTFVFVGLLPEVFGEGKYGTRGVNSRGGRQHFKGEECVWKRVSKDGKHYRIIQHSTGYFYQKGFLPSDTAEQDEDEGEEEINEGEGEPEGEGEEQEEEAQPPSKKKKGGKEAQASAKAPKAAKDAPKAAPKASPKGASKRASKRGKQ